MDRISTSRDDGEGRVFQAERDMSLYRKVMGSSSMRHFTWSGLLWAKGE